MNNKANLVPKTIYCPVCAKPIELKEIRDPLETLQILEMRYSQGAKGVCGCGVYLVFLTKPLPDNPTFTIQFNIYKEGGE